MRWLIDGYNVMHAGGRIAPKISRRGFGECAGGSWMRLARHSGPAVASETTVVLDASKPPGDFPSVSTYHGLTVLFALGDENADARIEALISEHTSPRVADRRLFRQPNPNGRLAAPLPVSDRPSVLGAA